MKEVFGQIIATIYIYREFTACWLPQSVVDAKEKFEVSPQNLQKGSGFVNI